MRSDRIKLHFRVLLILLTVVVLGLFLKDALHIHRTAEGLAVAEASAYFNKDQAARLWGASHGGVYVPVSPKTQPNPFLVHVPERDIYSPSGRLLTLMNPARRIVRNCCLESCRITTRS